MEAPSDLERAQVFAALGDPIRWRIVERLRVGALTASSIAEGFSVSRPAVSRHVRVLCEAGLLGVWRRGRQRFYRLRHDTLEEATRWLGSVASTTENARATAVEPPRDRPEPADSDDSWRCW